MFPRPGARVYRTAEADAILLTPQDLLRTSFVSAEQLLEARHEFAEAER